MTLAGRSTSGRSSAEPFLGESAGIQRAVQLATRFAQTDAPILLVGETGTGKELLARLIHRESARSGELVDVNCGALPRELVESTFFGHRRGAFSGAVEDGMGLVEAAHDGTLFLDEVCSLPLDGQVKLLRVLERGEYRRVGETGMRRSSFRVLAASQIALDSRVGAGSFRLDLLQRIAGVVIELPPLREREGDVNLLAEAFAGRHQRTLSAGAVRRLCGHHWPGNVRELQAAIRRACWFCQETELTADSVAEALQTGAVSSQPGAPLCAGEHGLLTQLLEKHGWDVTATARALDVNRTTLWRRMRRCGLRARDLKRAVSLHRLLKAPHPTAMALLPGSRTG